jgi:malonyl CoA-acyl carrier protein transacylase
MTTYIFPGQGSQFKGMGSELFPEFPELIQKADQLLGYSIVDLCLNNPNEQLTKTEYTQPALYIVNALSYMQKAKETTMKPDYVAGHSLGEYNALFASGVFDFETGIKLVQKRGALMSQATGGGMAAIVGLHSADVQMLLQKNELKDIVIANYNTHTQIVISGLKEAVSEAKALFIAAGAKLFIPLKVSGAFHSPYMQVAQQQFAEFLGNFNFAPPAIPVIANVTAKPYPPNQTSSYLADQITHPVEWTQSIAYLIDQGETIFEEIGPGKILTGLISRIQKGQ